MEVNYKDLISGEYYYFSSSKDSYGIFIELKDTVAYFKPIVKGFYLKSTDGLVGFEMKFTKENLFFKY